MQILKLILVRHGLSQANVARTVSGAKSNPELSQKGIKITTKASKSLKLKQIDLIYASHLIRAQQTAEILTQGKDFLTDDRLMEMNFGSWEGADENYLRTTYPDDFDFELMIGTNYVKDATGAESYQDVIDRCMNFMDDLKKQAGDKTVMLVCHGFTIRCLIAGIFGLDILSVGVPRNSSFTEIALDENNNFMPRLKSFNRPVPEYFA